MTPAFLLGLTSANDWPYLLYSGIGGCVVGSSWAAGLWVLYRRHQCHVDGCWRVGHRTTAAGDLACRKHHPEPALSRIALIARHKAARDG